MGDPPGLQTYNFYGEGIFSAGFNGSFCTNGMIRSTLSVLPPNYPGNPTNNAIGVPANFAGNNPAPVWSFFNGQWVQVPANTPPNPFPIFLWIPANSPPNPVNAVVTRFQATFTIPARVAGGFSLAQSLPLSWLNISNINPTGISNEYPNNFHLTRPGYPAWQPGDSFYPVTATSYPLFTTEYLNSLAPFCCLRFMDWMNTNNNVGVSWVTTTTPATATTPAVTTTSLVSSGAYTWANRPKVNVFGNGNGGAGGGQNTCYENMIALCNATGCDMWMNVPLQASDDWKVGFANLVANDPVYHLNPWLHVYYEHGNELWNTGFIAWQWVDEQASLDFEPGHVWNSNSGWSQHGWETAKLLMSDVTVMQPILGNLGRPILAGQYSWPTYNIAAGLSWIESNFGPPKNYLYGIAGAPYFGDLNTTSVTGALQSQMASCMACANQYSIKMCAYEAGQSLSAGNSNPPDEGLFNLNFSLQESPSMANQYMALATMWKQNGGDLCNFFTNCGVWSKFGFWSALPLGSYIDDLSDPVCIKFNTLASLNNSFGCNCGNSQPSPTVSTSTSTSTSTQTSASSPVQSSSSASHGSTNSSSSLSSSSSSAQSTPTSPGHWSKNAIYGRVWVWDLPKDAPMTPLH